MNADRDIKSNLVFFKAGAWAVGTWRRKTTLRRGDNVADAMGSNSVQGYLAERELPETHSHAIVRSGGDAGALHGGPPPGRDPAGAVGTVKGLRPLLAGDGDPRRGAATETLAPRARTRTGAPRATNAFGSRRRSR